MTNKAGRNGETALTEEDVIDLIQKSWPEKDGEKVSLRTYAKELGISAGALSLALADPPTRQLGPLICDCFGIGKRKRITVRYEYFYKK